MMFGTFLALFLQEQRLIFEAEYGERWGEGAARYFSIEADFLDEETAL